MHITEHSNNPSNKTIKKHTTPLKAYIWENTTDMVLPGRFERRNSIAIKTLCYSISPSWLGYQLFRNILGVLIHCIEAYLTTRGIVA